MVLRNEQSLFVDEIYVVTYQLDIAYFLLILWPNF